MTGPRCDLGPGDVAVAGGDDQPGKRQAVLACPVPPSARVVGADRVEVLARALAVRAAVEEVGVLDSTRAPARCFGMFLPARLFMASSAGAARPDAPHAG